MTIWVVGQVTVDRIYRGPDTAAALEPHGMAAQPRIGGKAFNIAAALARLGAGVRLVSAVGDDHFGKLAMKKMKLAGIGTELVIDGSGGRTKPLITPVTNLTEGRHGERVVSVDLDPNMDRYYGIALTRALTSINQRERLPQAIIYTLEFEEKLLTSLAEVIRQAQKSHEMLVIGNPAPRGSGPPSTRLGELLRLSNCVIPNRYEARYLAGDETAQASDSVMLARRIREIYRLDECVCTLGDEGWAWSSNVTGEGRNQIASGTVLEKVGASDVFTGTFTLLALRGAAIEVAAFGAGVAAREAIQKRGGHERFPALDELRSAVRREGGPLSQRVEAFLGRPE